MKRLIALLLVLLMIPIGVSAKNYDYDFDIEEYYPDGPQMIIDFNLATGNGADEPSSMWTNIYNPADQMEVHWYFSRDGETWLELAMDDFELIVKNVK